MITYYVSPAPGDGGTGNDANDGLTTSTPKATIQAVNTLIASRTDHVTIWLSNLGTHKPTAAITSGVAPTSIYNQYYRCWEESAAGNYTTLNGDSIPRWVWQQNGGDRFHGDTATSGSLSYTHFFDGKFSQSSSQNYGLVYASSAHPAVLHNIEIDASNIVNGAITGTTFYLHATHLKVSAVSTYPTNWIGGACHAHLVSCLFENCDDYGLRILGGIVEGCVLKNWGLSAANYGISPGNAAATMLRVNNCAFYNTTGTGKWGIAWDEGSAGISCYNNVFENMEYGLGDKTTGNASHCPAGYLGCNAFYSVTNHYAFRGGYTALISPAVYDLTLTASPFLDIANNDLRLPADSSLRGRGMVIPAGFLPGGSFTTAAQRCDIGPLQYGIPNLTAAPGYVG